MTASFADSRPEHQTMPTNKWPVAASVMFGAILTNLDASIVNVALPYMQKSFGVGVDRIRWVVTSYLVAVSVMLPMTGVDPVWCTVLGLRLVRFGESFRS
jgi:DHA2 family multidrug resistance protein